MSGPRALNRLHVFRSLRAHIQSRWNVGLVLVDRTDGPYLLSEPSETPLTALNAALNASSTTLEAHDEALGRMREGPSAPEVATHPAGFGMIGVPCHVNGRLGRLVALPLATNRSLGRMQSSLSGYLVDQGHEVAEAAELAESIPALSETDLDHLAGLLRVMAEESRRFTEQWARSERRLDLLRRSSRSRYSRIVGKCLAMQRLFSMMDRIVSTDSTVYLHGANGTGKELVARELHDNSPRSERPFIVQNCSALNDNLLESELFGHRRGSFTGAHQDKPGLFDLADSGTFFLDEIGDMSPALQVKLLRVLQEGTFTPVGGLDVHRVDVRVICATNRDLKAMVDGGTFREDLYYRINVISLTIPPLRDRKEDIGMLVDFFLEKAMRRTGQPDGKKKLSPQAMQRLMEYDWPGNVRELENEIERLVVLTGALMGTIGEDLLSAHIRMRHLTDPTTVAETDLSLPDALERMERAMIQEQLRANRWNKTRAAEALGISRRNLIRKVKAYGFDRRGSDRNTAERD